MRQFRTGWSDGPEFITQCPIRPGRSYTYKFTITAQEGTLWWHAHSSWLRATVYGALIILPRLRTTYPFTFTRPHRQIPILLGLLQLFYLFMFDLLTNIPFCLISIYVLIMRLRYLTLFAFTGEWWNRNPIDVVNQATRTGAAPNVSDAFTINGQPGDLYQCSSSGTFLAALMHLQTKILH